MHQSNYRGDESMRAAGCAILPPRPPNQRSIHKLTKKVSLIGQTQDQSSLRCKKCVCLAAVQARRLKL